MPHDKVIHAGRERLRWYPAGSTKITDKLGLGVCYVYPAPKGRQIVLAYAGNAAKPAFHYNVKDQAAASEQVRSFFANLAGHKARVEEYRAKSNSGHTLKVGDIITNSWGYDQTNVDWYRVVRVSKVYVWLEEVSGVLREATGPMAGMETLHVDVSDDNPANWGPKGSGKITKHKASGQNVTMKHGSGSKWDGRPLYSSWYA